MRHVPFATSTGRASAVISGMMRISTSSDDEIRDLYASAREAGVDFFDHADIYGHAEGGVHHCERRFGEALNLSASEREAITIQTKVGIVPGTGFDFSREHILEGVNGSLKALGTDYIDVLLLHRPDALVEPDEVAAAFDELAAAGKVRAFGVSNHTPRQIELLRASLSHELVANQIQLSLTHCPAITQGLTMNMASEAGSVTRDGGGILDYCRLTNMTVQAWSPFQKGFLDGVFLGSPDFPELNEMLGTLGADYRVSPAAIALAWITRHPAKMQVVLGTTNPTHLVDAAAGADVELSREHWYALYRAAGHLLP
ncbi:aldo/keto reductase [Nanchangia anserum]|uniref:Aldo/keto reductase n=1 Tax=Nanchangia anserum TaxID=2692125 RepID=A0A8I0G840_9ACTO|nr:aldo/keto reductase [Nanchangia anserum]MBD3688889.1 aldo/keto reductase [Nanchangia anserum]QOX81155.1 aldo/keto reductase [Nanchangia anserum]